MLTVLFTDPDILRYISGGKPYTTEEIFSIFSFFLKQYEANGFGPWAVASREDQAVIGLAGFKTVPHLENPDLGFSFLKPYWGKGYATETGQALVKFGFEKNRFAKIGAVVNRDNAATQRVLKKCGLSYEKTVVHHDKEFALYTAVSLAPGLGGAKPHGLQD